MKPGMRQVLSTLLYIRSLPKRTITMGGSEAARAFFIHATKPHPRYRLIGNKTIGVGLIELPEEFEAFLKGPRMQALRTNRTRAIKKGFSFLWMKSTDHKKDMLEINRSATFRQGREMEGSYTDPEALEEYLLKNEYVCGVVDVGGRMRAYLVPIFCGEVCVVSRILGHRDHLDDGIMYLLISEMVRDLIAAGGTIKYLMYDMFIGANDGLRYFKERLGFKAYRVRWLWKDRLDLLPP